MNTSILNTLLHHLSSIQTDGQNRETVWLINKQAILIWMKFIRQYTNLKLTFNLPTLESIQVIDGFGIQLDSKVKFGKENNTFIDFNVIEDIIINETVTMVCNLPSLEVHLLLYYKTKFPLLYFGVLPIYLFCNKDLYISVLAFIY